MDLLSVDPAGFLKAINDLLHVDCARGLDKLIINEVLVGFASQEMITLQLPSRDGVAFEPLWYGPEVVSLVLHLLHHPSAVGGKRGRGCHQNPTRQP